MVTLQLQQLNIPTGQRLQICNLNWSEFEAILNELGDRRKTRIAYSNKTLEIRMPSPEHEVNKEIIGDIIKILLDELEIDCECFGSTTFKEQSMASGVEPDQCFYIENHARVRGKRRIDLAIDPPPDLAIEVDVTSRTQMSAYISLGVRELWIYEGEQLNIYILQLEQYQQVLTSSIFPNLPILDIVTETLEESMAIGRSPALRALRRRIQQQQR
ncbi:Uma2 family endonuclease [Spirulina sp. 06S082]|uniref:Uma2 family endonuclease n=1 Tax=Spirulina sp. 06S082 TaxID=3110248 RepID=UPI002B20E5A4|nr:Uma2 family endonuclease [Spirulina sp. 06S082]MEA5469128.1 Uma2 family endonuclease [Spirulina sp. 06S082]